ncbi:transcriptional regulator [bacteria symbiont BFo2 of Frankliniella occidentalis]|nr:transcriptional regulator [bacteria symbiont BFo2 of Frankliniella occidentalis]KYP94133.1 transcriptional regulator [bacteria symbiont BFo2 of Frankliniella occidentalis]KYP95108.1 transcriptional regulator [bacteria symbiont BFo2 of Frankliniella occidentalis]
MPVSLKLHHLRALVNVVSQGSIRAASRNAGLSQPALTKAIQELEQILGTRVLERHPQGIQLNDVGEHFYRHARLVLEEIRIAQEEVSQHLGDITGQIHLGIGGSMACTLMPKVIDCFQQRYPRVNVHIVEGQLSSMLPALRQGTLDFTINTVTQLPFERELSFEPLAVVDYPVVVRQGHPLRHAKHLCELSEAKWTMPPSTSSYCSLLEQLYSGHSLPQVRVTYESLIACASLVTQSDFLSIISSHIVNTPILSDQLVALDLVTPAPQATFYFVQRKDHQLGPISAYLAQLFRDFSQTPR